MRVHYIDLEISWEQFIKVMDFVKSFNIDRFGPSTGQRGAFFFFLRRLRALQKCRTNTHARNSESLDKVLAQHRMAAAKDPRDHIYSLLDLASEKPPLSPNYKEATAKDVFLDMANWAVCRGSLDILGLCSDPSNPKRVELLRCPQDENKKDPVPLPSWVPDFSDLTQLHSLTGIDMLRPNKVSVEQFNANSNHVAAPNVIDDGVVGMLR